MFSAGVITAVSQSLTPPQPKRKKIKVWSPKIAIYAIINSKPLYYGNLTQIYIRHETFKNVRPWFFFGGGSFLKPLLSLLSGITTNGKFWNVWTAGDLCTSLEKTPVVGRRKRCKTRANQLQEPHVDLKLAHSFLEAHLWGQWVVTGPELLNCYLKQCVKTPALHGAKCVCWLPEGSSTNYSWYFGSSRLLWTVIILLQLEFGSLQLWIRITMPSAV